MNAPRAPPPAMSSPSGLFGPCWGKTGAPVTRKPSVVKHALATAILAATARKLADITSRLNWTQALACSSVPGLGVDRANADPEHLNRRPSENTNAQELAPARRFAIFAVDVQPAEVN
jgi:hypothetical protein